MVSDDLVNWEYQGIAVFPSKTDDRDGCFSGSAVEDEGKLYLYYTGVRYLVENPEDINLFLDEQFVSAQMLITSEDGYHFDNIKDKKTIIPVFIKDYGDARHTRKCKQAVGIRSRRFSIINKVKSSCFLKVRTRKIGHTEFGLAYDNVQLCGSALIIFKQMENRF